MRLKVLAEDAEFDYSDISHQNWRKLLHDTQDEVGIDFDTENDEAVEDREITIEQTHWEGTKCTALCELRLAGGDWQSSTCYFRCQIKSGYFAGKYSGHMFIFIPSKEEGNIYLEKHKGTYFPPDSDKNLKPDQDQCWKAMRKHLDDLVKESIREVKKAKDQ